MNQGLRWNMLYMVLWSFSFSFFFFGASFPVDFETEEKKQKTLERQICLSFN